MHFPSLTPFTLRDRGNGTQTGIQMHEVERGSNPRHAGDNVKPTKQEASPFHHKNAHIGLLPQVSSYSWLVQEALQHISRHLQMRFEKKWDD